MSRDPARPRRLADLETRLSRVEQELQELKKRKAASDRHPLEFLDKVTKRFEVVRVEPIEYRGHCGYLPDSIPSSKLERHISLLYGGGEYEIIERNRRGVEIQRGLLALPGKPRIRPKR